MPTVKGRRLWSALISFLKDRSAAEVSRLALGMNSIIGVRGAAFAYSRRLGFAAAARREAVGGTCRAAVTNHEFGAPRRLKPLLRAPARAPRPLDEHSDDAGPLDAPTIMAWPCHSRHLPVIGVPPHGRSHARIRRPGGIDWPAAKRDVCLLDCASGTTPSLSTPSTRRRSPGSARRSPPAGPRTIPAAPPTRPTCSPRTATSPSRGCRATRRPARRGTWSAAAAGSLMTGAGPAAA